jgi:hypothetical protein
MSDLQLGLLAIGALVVAGVLAYNHVQERAARRDAEKSFRGAHADVLIEGAPARHEPAPAMPRREPVAAARRPDARIDYVVEVALPDPAAASLFAERWKAHGHRYRGRARLDPPGSGALRAGLQLATRDGPVSEAELIEFRAAIETAAAAAGATVSAPEMKGAVEAARALDRFCAEADVQVVFHIVPAEGATFSRQRIEAIAQASGLAAEEQGYARREPGGGVAFTLRAREGEARELTVSLDVPRAPDTRRSFQEMASFAHQLAVALGGSVVDDNGNVLDERAVAAIGAQLDAVRAQFDAHGLAPGSEQALRLFS